MKFDEDIDKKPILGVYLQRPLYEKKEGKLTIQLPKDKILRKKTRKKTTKIFNHLQNLRTIHFSKFLFARIKIIK
jgi:hypothetical protein